jgi:hypothetical protein
MRDGLRQMPADRAVALVPHTGAGLFLPAIGSGRVLRCLGLRVLTIRCLPRRELIYLCQKDGRHASLPLSRDGR